MARKDKYYGTNVHIHGDKLKKLEEKGYGGTHNQFRVVCKAKSLAEANRKAEAYGLITKCFHSEYTAETGNDVEVSMANVHDFIVCVNGTIGKSYVSLASLDG